MEQNELEKTVNEPEGEVMDTIGNPYHPYRVEFPYEVSFTTPQDEHITSPVVLSETKRTSFPLLVLQT